MDRRLFLKTITVGAAAYRVSDVTAASSKKKMSLKIGHTGLTWIDFSRRAGGQDPLSTSEYVEQAARDIAALGFWGVEYFGQQVEAMETKGGIGNLLEPLRLPLTSAYCPVNLSDPSKRDGAIADFSRWGKLVKKYGGTVLVIGPNPVKRETYNLAEHKADIVATLNDLGKAANDIGLTAVLHQHTGTCVETRDETYSVLHSIDTRYVKFGPDIGQLQKGGSDPVQVVKDFLPLINHMHLKDYSGGENYLGYCPLGEGKVNVPSILAMMNGRKIAGHVMVELDGSRGQPLSAGETAAIAKKYLEGLGADFRPSA